MAVYVKGNETKKKMIMHTYERLCNQGAGELTVRNLAKELNVSAAALYRYFDSLDYLILVASIRFLDEYMSEYQKLYEQEKNVILFYIRCWELFNSYAFKRPDIFFRLFWGYDAKVLGKALQDYFELFPLEGTDTDTGYQYVLLRTADMNQRDMMVLRRIEKKGYLSHEDTYFLSYANPIIVKGMVESAIAMDRKECIKQEKLCNYLVTHNTEAQLENYRVKNDSERSILKTHILNKE